MVVLSLLLLGQQVGDTFVATGQLLKPVGRHLAINARPVDLALSADGAFLLVKENRGLTVVRTGDWKVVQESRVTGGASLAGVLCGPGGEVVFSDAASGVHFGKLGADGTVAWGQTVQLPRPGTFSALAGI